VTLSFSQSLEALGTDLAIDAQLCLPFLARAAAGASRAAHGALYENVNGVARIAIEGPLGRKAFIVADVVWFDGYDRVERAVQAAAEDSKVESIMLVLDSPGGTVAGIRDTTRAMRQALDASGKPCIAHCDLAASAGYWLASVADEVYVSTDGVAGSIGTYTTHYDLSRSLEQDGVKITRIQDPEGKTAGDWIRPLDDETKKELQSQVSAFSSVFYEHVGARRGMTAAAVRDLNARIFHGQKAVEAKLADGVMTISQSMQRAGELAQKRKKRKMSEMASFLGLPVSASAEEIAKAAAEAKPLLELGRKAQALTGEHTAEAAAGVLVAWKQDSAEASNLRAVAAQNAAAAEATKRHGLLVQLAQVQAPALVWKDPSNTALGAVQEYAEMSTGALEAYVARRASHGPPVALRASEKAEASVEPNDDEVKAHMRREGMKNEAIARAHLRKQRGLQ